MFFKFFKRGPKTPLMAAITMANDAIMIAYEYQRDLNYTPREQDLLLFDKLAEVLSRNHSTAQRIARNMRQRARGELEDGQILIDPTLF